MDKSRINKKVGGAHLSTAHMGFGPWDRRGLVYAG